MTVIPGLPSSAVTGVSPRTGGGGVAKTSASGNAGTFLLRDVVSVLDFSGADRSGASDSATALKNALAEASALAVGGYGPSQGVGVHVPGGRWLLGSKIAMPAGVTLLGDGYNATVFQHPSNFADNCVFEPQAINGSQEYMGLMGFSLYGPGGTTPSGNQANAGTASTVATTISAPHNALLGGDLVVTGTGLGYAASGTLLIRATVRVIYQSWTEGGGNTTFHGCYITSGYGTSFMGGSIAITAGDAVAAITTNNIVGIRLAGLGATSLLRDVNINSFTDNCLQDLFCNCLDVQNVWANISNRDTVLLDAQVQHSWFRAITAQYPDAANTGNGFAAVHVRGMSSSMNNTGSLSFQGLYFELSSASTIGLWLDNIGSVSGENIRVQGGSVLSSQTLIQIDSAQSSPTTQDGLHTANFDLRNILCTGTNRVPIRDNVRGWISPAVASNGAAITRYATEDLGPVGFVSREASLRKGTLPAYAETLPFDIGTTANPMLPTSGTQQGAAIPLLGGVSYNGTIIAVSNSQGATWGSNADGHWYIAIYDPTGNLVAQTADQGGTGLGAGVTPATALTAPLVPAQDGMYQVVLMVYIGTGGSPVMPKMLGISGITTTRPVSGMPRKSFTANTGQTTGANAYANPGGGGLPPATIGTLAGNASLFWVAVYHS